jgi:metal-responsive CopG/Arc/MetJ family transcriptional regulator
MGGHYFQLTPGYMWRYKSGMKTKTSITLSQDILRAIDAHMGAYRSRSDFIETAARVFIEHLEKKEAELRDLEIINKHADALNNEAEDVLGYQVPI